MQAGTTQITATDAGLPPGKLKRWPFNLRSPGPLRVCPYLALHINSYATPRDSPEDRIDLPRRQRPPPCHAVIDPRDDDAPEKAERHAEVTCNTRGRLVNRLPRSPAVLIHPELPPVGNPEPLDALRADERPQRPHEPDATAAGHANHFRRPVNRNEQSPHGRSHALV